MGSNDLRSYVAGPLLQYDQSECGACARICWWCGQEDGVRVGNKGSMWGLGGFNARAKMCCRAGEGSMVLWTVRRAGRRGWTTKENPG